MTVHSSYVYRRIAALVVCAAVAGIQLRGSAQTPPRQGLPNVEQLKLKAFEAVKAGKFDLGRDYLAQAAAVSGDPSLARMADWARQFEQQRRSFLEERRQAYEKTVSQVRLLSQHSWDSQALEAAAKVKAAELAGTAYALAENKAQFRNEPWVGKLLADSKELAERCEKSEHWLHALRLYSQLGAIEPEVPEWKERMKLAARRIRLIALYTPEQIRKIQEADVRERDQVEAVLDPNARPTTRPANDDPDLENGKTDWHETLRGIRMDMLSHALVNAHANYYRAVSYKKLVLGGLQGLRLVLTTPVLFGAFPESQIQDAAKRTEFLGIVDALSARMEQAREQEEADLTQAILRELRDGNRRTVSLPEPVLVSEFADGAFSVLDPFSNIIWPSDVDEFQKTTKGEFSGVGIQIQSDEAGNLRIVSPLEDSPAFNAGVKPDSIITHIDGKSARWIGLNQAVKRITGPPGTTVTLTIREADGSVKDYTLRRETIKVAVVKGWVHLPGGGWDYFIDPEEKIGYIRLTNFTKTASADMDEAIRQITQAGARGLVLDLRMNPGGLLSAATDIVDKFLAQGLIVETRPDRSDSPNPPNRISVTRKGGQTDLPLVVLVNQLSASASEIVAGALKDHGRALTVGERTFGKGSVQILYPLGSSEAFLKLTTSHYYLPSGKCIHREENSKDWGVDPDVVVEMTPAQMRAAIEARQALDVLRRPDPSAAPATQPLLVGAEAAGQEAQAHKDPLATDTQLSAALLLMRLQLAGGDQLWAQAGGNSQRRLD